LLPPPEFPQQERRRLARAIQDMRGAFALFPVESNLSWADSLVFLDALAADLAPGGLKLRKITLGRDAWNLLAVLHTLEDIQPDEFVVVLGLESTPSILPAGGEEHKRPPALNALNVMREAIERKLSVPTILWCVPYVYDALLKHAPDFFDHFSALFAVMEEKSTPPPEPEHRIFEPPGTESVLANRSLRALESDLKFYEQRLRELTTPSLERARALIGYSTALSELPVGDVTDQKLRSLVYACEAVDFLKQTDDIPEFIRALRNVGNIYSDIDNGDIADNIKHAIDWYKRALEFCPKEKFPIEWAKIQYNLGTAYSDFPGSDRTKISKLAIECFQSALTIYNEDEFPVEWAGLQVNLGNLYLQFPQKQFRSAIHQAISHYESALNVFTEDGNGILWARTQNNLATAYRYLEDGERDVNQQKAISCCEAALRIYRKDNFPDDWADVQNNLGGVYSELVFGSRDVNLKTAIHYFQESLIVFTLDRNPFSWAIVQMNVGMAECDLDEYDMGLEKMRKALDIFKNMNHSFYVLQTERYIGINESKRLLSKMNLDVNES
jgi:tetratricopeptide (TPR) repeat protein